MAEETIQIHGMTCAACVRRVERGLESLEGVKSASVNLATEKARVEYDSDLVDNSAMKTKIKELGYQVLETRALPPANCKRRLFPLGA